MESTSRSKRWFDKLPPEKQAAVRERRRINQRKRRANLSEEDRARERKEKREWYHRTHRPSVQSAFELYAKLLERARKDARLAAVLKRYNRVSLGRWRKALKNCIKHQEKTAEKGTGVRQWINLRGKLNRQWQQVIRKRGFAELSMHMLKLVAIEKKKKREAGGGEGEGELDADEIAGVQRRCDIAQAILKACRSELEKACNQLRSQLDSAAVYHPRWVKHEDEKIHRSVCRIRYHRAKKTTPGAVPLADIYPELYREFMRVAEEKEDEPVPETDRQRAAEVTIVVEQLLLDVLAMVEEEERREQQEVVSSQEPRDAGNVGIEEMCDEEEEDGAEEGGEEATDSNGGVGEAELLQEGEEILLQDPELREAAGPNGVFYAPRVTYALKCACDPWTHAQACALKTRLLGIADSVCKEEFAPLLDFEKRGLTSLAAGAVCYTGLRSVNARLSSVRALVHVIRLVEDSFGRANSVLDDIIAMDDEWKWLPKAVRTIVESQFSDDENARRMTQASVQKEYGARLAAIAKKVAETENKFCQICHRSWEESQLVHKPKFKIDRYLREPRTDKFEQYNVCKTCLKDAAKAKGTQAQRFANPAMPRCARANKVDFEEVPNVLRGLNWIEKDLIQLVKPIRSIICLNNVGGNRTSMRSVGGAMVLLPVPTEGTMHHVAQTLPSDAGLTILVSSASAGCKLVRLPKVLRALRWLVKHNPHYKDIKINSAFCFSRNSVIFTRADKNHAGVPATDAELAGLITDEEDPPSLLRHEDMAPEVVRPMHGIPPPGLAHEQYALLKHPYEKMSIDTPFLETKCFPWHWPRGFYSVHSPRQEKVTLCDMVKWWLACKDRRVAQDPQALAFFHGLLEQKGLTSAMGIQVRFNRGKLFNDALLKALKEGMEEIEGSFLSSASVMRGHAAYFRERRLEVRAHVAMFGPPTWFLTLNPAERRWEEVLLQYQAVFGTEVTTKNLFEYICRDPYFFARCFQQRLRTVLLKLIRGTDQKPGPFGVIIHYFVRVEYQHRGTQHVHCILWAKDAPKEDATDAERLAYIDRHVTARMPDKQSEPELYELIRNEQMHYEQHSNTCLRDKRVRGKMTKQCRFDFPRPCTPKTIVNKAFDRLQALPGTRLKMYYTKRRPCDVYVNDYNPATTMAWKANTDIQYIWTGCRDVINYVTGYATKNEKSKDMADDNLALKEANNSKSGFRALVDCVRQRHSGLLEVIDTLAGHKLCQFGNKHVFLNANASDKRNRMLRPREEIEKEVADGIIRPAYVENDADVYYPGRNEDLENYSFFNILIRFRVAKGAGKRRKQTDGGEDGEKDGEEDGEEEGEDDEEVVGAPPTAHSSKPDPFEPHFHVHNPASPFYDHQRATTTLYGISGTTTNKYHLLLGSPLVPRLFWPHLEESNDEKREDYYRQLCFLFIPWRDEDALMGDAETYEARWSAFVEQFAVDQPEAFADIKKIIMQHEALIAQDKEVIEKRKAHRAQLNAMQVDEDPEADGPVVFDRVVDDQAHASAVASMNPGQRELYDEVIAHVAAQDVHSRAEKAILESQTLTPAQQYDELARLGPRPAAMLRVVVGTAGCGKSFVINALADRLTLDYTKPETRASAPAVLLAAPTGLAAVQIRGSTLHKMLGIEVQHGRDAVMKELKGMKLNELRLKFRNARLLIIDELSMISAIVLMKSHLRLVAIKDSSRTRSLVECPELFGGMNIVLLGDLMQLNPVCAPAIFEKLKYSTANRIFGSMYSDFCLFDQFKYSELTINMRQKGDEQFGSLLQRLRVQALTEDDIKLLETRIIERSANERPMEAAARKMVELMADPAACPMALFATNAEVKKFNHLVVDLLQLNTVVVVANDTEPRRKAGAGRGNARADERPGGKTSRIYQKNKYTIRKPPGSSRRPRSKKPNGGAGEEGEDEEGQQQEPTEDDTNKAAGLEKNLLLAENGRVMLRRNIDAPNGLVNGACGVLKKIVRSMGDADEVIALMVLFDGHTTETIIRKSSAVFDLNDDEQATREQFPVAMAFGATVHKAQGLTLSSAIISTSKFFPTAPGQGFVALSRVRSLDTLYLVDLHPDKLRCSRPALIKYNELRATVNLPPFAEPVARKPTREQQPPPSTPRGAPTPSRGSSAKLRVPSQGIDETPRASRAPPTSHRPSDAAAAGKARRNLNKETRGDDEAMRPPPAKKKKTPNSRRGQQDVDAGPWLTLHNDNKRDCFMIAAVNLLHTVDVLRNGVIEAAPILEAAGSLTPTMAELVATLKGQRRDVVGLRLAAGLPEETGDCSAFLTTMLEGFSEVHEKTCKTTLAVDRTCTNGHINRNVHPSGVLYQHILNAAALPDGFVEGSIDDIYTTNQVSAATCGECSAPIASANVRIHPAGSHIIFHINRSTHAGGVMDERPLLISGVNVKRMIVLGQRVRIVACVQHIAWDKGDAGHYVVWRRGKENGWSVVDDHRQYGQRQLPDKLSTIHLIVFEVY